MNAPDDSSLAAVADIQAAVGIAEPPPPPEPQDPPGDWRDALGQIERRLEALAAGVAVCEGGITGLSGQVVLIPQQVRTLGGKVEGLATSISEPRCRAMLLGVVSIYDLTDQLVRSIPPDAPDAAALLHRRNYEVLRTQIGQVLASNGLSIIAIAPGALFDPIEHCAVKSDPTGDAALDGQIREVLRAGFRNEQAVLRYAEVAVWKAASTAPIPPVTDPEPSTLTPTP